MLQKPPSLLVQADPRVMRPAVRGLLRAAVEVARPGSTVRFSAFPARDRARVAVMVDGCRRLPGNRLPELPALSLLRRVAKAHGGSLSARRVPQDGCEFRLDLPRLQPD